MLECLLERLAASPYRERMILKGGMRIAALVGIDSRTTMDMDVTLQGYPLSEEALRRALRDICAIPLQDGVRLTVERIQPIREDDEYGGTAPPSGRSTKGSKRP